jgi:hypothetical protein
MARSKTRWMEQMVEKNQDGKVTVTKEELIGEQILVF